MADTMFKIHKHYEKDGLYFIETDYGLLHTKNKEDYDKTVEDGFIIFKLDDYDYDKNY